MPLPVIENPLYVLALLTLLALVVPLFSRVLRVPDIIGLSVAGFMVGGHTFNLVGDASILEPLSKVGMLYIFFLAGLEMDIPQFRKRIRQALAFGSMTFVFPFTLGMLLGLAFLEPEQRLAGAMLLGSVMCAHTPLSYPVVSRLGLVRLGSVTAAIAGTMLDDFLALLVLVAVAKSVQAPEGLDLAWVGGGLIALIATTVIVLPQVARWFFKHQHGSDTAEFMFIFGCLLGMASLASAFEMEPLLGAYFAGVALNTLVPEQSRMMSQVKFMGNALFIPLFLLKVGTLINPAVFMEGSRTWLLATLMIGSVLVAKFGAAWITARCFGYEPEEKWIMFGMSVNKAVATVAATMVGYRLGLFNDDILNAVIALVLVTCSLGPWITEVFGRRLALKLAQATPRHVSLPQRILVPLANPGTANALMDLAFMVRDRKAAQPVFPLTVAEDGPQVQQAVAEVEKTLSHAVIHAAAADVPVRPETRVDSDVAAGVIRAIKELRISCVIMGWSGRVSVPKVIFSSVLDNLLEQTPQLVLVCKLAQPINTAKRLFLIVPPLVERLSGFRESARALKTLAYQAGVTLQLVVLKRDAAELCKEFEQTQPPLKATAVELEQWSDVWAVFRGQLQENDMVALVSCRGRSLAWQPTLDRLPQKFCAEFPRHNFLVVYPAETAPDAAGVGEALEGSITVQGLLQAERVTFGLGARDLRSAVSCMLERFLLSGGQASIAKIERLCETLTRSGLEITSGVMLLHVHSDDVQTPVALLGLSPEGFAVADDKKPVHSVFVLLSPVGVSPEVHLRALSQIANLVMATPEIEQLGRADSLARLRAILERDGAETKAG